MPRLRRREGDCEVKDCGELDVPTRCRTEQRGEVQDHLFLHQFLRAVVFVFVVKVIILSCIVVAISGFFSHIYAQQVFSTLFTSLLNTIVCVCRRGVKGGIFQLVFG